MEYITKKDLIDCSTPDEFCFSLCCMECKTVWKSTPIRFSKAGKKPENENRKIIPELFMMIHLTTAKAA